MPNYHANTEVRETPSADEPFPRIRLSIPFLTTSGLWDLCWLFSLLPFWWLIGVEQIIAPVLLTWTFIKISLASRSFRFTAQSKLFMMFFVAAVISGFFIVESYRLLTFMRSTLNYYTALLLLLIVPTVITETYQVRRFLKHIVFAAFFAAFIGLLGVLGLWRPSFTSVVGQLMPASIISTELGQAVSMRTLGGPGWFAPIGSYFRVNSFFLFSTMYALFLALTVPVAIWLLKESRGLKKTANIIVVLVMLSNLIFATGRIATLALCVGLVYWLVTATPLLLRSIIVLLALITFTVGVSLTPLDIDATEALEAAIFARGAGSFEDRLGVYIHTVEGFWERPVLGWGTERNIEGLRYPAGSHSYFLGILYKHGSIGFLIFLALIVSIAIALWHKKSVQIRSSVNLRLIVLGRVIFIIFLLAGLTDAFDLDATTNQTLWAILACTLSAPYQQAQQSNSKTGG
ncbi:MAG: O-antigen ligase family protein [Desulfurococcaceae archaeon]